MIKKLILTLLFLCYPSTAKDPQQKLIILVIGVDSTAKDDADEFALEAMALRNAMLSSIPSSYKPIVKSILRKDATRENCLNGFKWVKEITQPGDLVIIYVGAHGGSKISKEYKFYPVDKPIYGAEIKDMLVGLPTDVLLIMDTCHSGAIVSDFEKVPDIFIITACSHEETAFSWGLCVILMQSFIYGDENSDGVITIREIITYVENHPKYGKHPVVSKGSPERTLIDPTRAAA